MSKIKDYLIQTQEADRRYRSAAPGETVVFKAATAGTPEIDGDNSALYGVNICMVGEAKGHGVHLEQRFIDKLVELSNAAVDLKCRFGHPGMCTESLGTYLGKFMNFRVEGNKAVADLYMDPISKIAPSGNLHDWTLAMAKDNPDKMGPSICFEEAYRYRYTNDNRVVIRHEDEDEDWYPSYRYTYEDTGEDADPMQVNFDKLYVMIGAISACDLVDEPAATDGMYSKAFGRQFKGFFDQFPAAWSLLQSNPALMRFVEQQMPIAKPWLREYAAGIKAHQNKQFNTQPPMRKFSEKAAAAMRRLGVKYDIDATTTDGNNIRIITTATDPAVGDQVVVVADDGTTTPAPDGTHIINGGPLDGAVIVTSGGAISEYTPYTGPIEDPAANPDSPMSEELSAIRESITSLSASITEMQGQLSAIGGAPGAPPAGGGGADFSIDDPTIPEYNRKGYEAYQRGKARKKG